MNTTDGQCATDGKEKHFYSLEQLRWTEGAEKNEMISFLFELFHPIKMTFHNLPSTLNDKFWQLSIYQLKQPLHMQRPPSLTSNAN